MSRRRQRSAAYRARRQARAALRFVATWGDALREEGIAATQAYIDQITPYLATGAHRSGGTAGTRQGVRHSSG
jgi:hypothetical protein